MNRLVSRYFISSVLVAVLWPVAARAADLTIPIPVAEQQPQLSLPAVSGINGKLEVDAGYLSVPDSSTNDAVSSGAFGASGSLSVPIGISLGFQGDLMVRNTGGVGVTWGGAAHLFTRDPNNYLIGVTAAAFRTPTSTVTGIGPEGELYLGDFSIEAWAGVDNVNYDDSSLSDVTGGFGFIDGVYYLTPDARVSLGASSVLGNNALHLGGEYQFHDFGYPLSATADARIGSEGSIFTIGLKGYFGGDDNKSLKDRQRQDDPRNRVLDLFTAAGNVPFETAQSTPWTQYTDEESCTLAGFYWDSETCLAAEP